MKLAGREIKGPNSETIVLPRGEGEPIVLTAMAVLDQTPFEKLCLPPKPPVVVRPGGDRSYNVEDPKFVKAMEEYGKRRTAWLVVTSLRLGTPELEWDTVRYDDPNSWPGYYDELRDAGFTESEIVRVIQAVMVANALDDAKLEEARKRFLASRGARAAASSSPVAEPSSTPSGEPASDSD